MKQNLFYTLILIIFISTNCYSSQKEDIIKNLNKTENITFNFEQTINKKKENGNCVIKYPKLIYCSYEGIKGKKIVSNGNSLVIKITNSNILYRYPLKSTPLNYILDKDYIISQIKKLEPRIIKNKYINFTLLDENQTINIFFNKKDLNLIGWQTEDIYQNLVITFISNVKLNQNLDDDVFKLPKKN